MRETWAGLRLLALTNYPSQSCPVPSSPTNKLSRHNQFLPTDSLLGNCLYSFIIVKNIFDTFGCTMFEFVERSPLGRIIIFLLKAIREYLSIGKFLTCVCCCTYCHPYVKYYWSMSRFPLICCLKYCLILPRTWCSTYYVGNRKVKAKKRYRKFGTNHVSNTKYTFWTFMPHNLLEQFGMSFMNRYFLFVACVQLIPEVSPVNPVTTWFPLIVVFCFTAMFAAIDDIRRLIGDKKLNNRNVTYINKKGKEKRVTSKSIRVGDLVKVFVDEEIPCDLVCVYSSGKEGAAFITTANLDGEVDLKPRPAPKPLYKYIEKINHPDYEPPPEEEEEEDEDDDDSEEKKSDDEEYRSSDEDGGEDEKDDEEEELQQISDEKEELSGSGDENVFDEEEEESSDFEEGGEEVQPTSLDEVDEEKTRDVLYDDDEDVDEVPEPKEIEEEADGEEKKKKKKKKRKKKKRVKQFWPFMERFEATIVCPQPSDEIYEFNSSMEVKGMKESVSLSADQLLLQSCMLKNTEWAIGICVYNGNETKCGMNKRKVPSKRTRSDFFMDKISSFVFCFQILIFLLFGIVGNIYKELDRKDDVWYLGMDEYPKGFFLIVEPLLLPVRFWLLTTYMIPISLKVTLDIMKFCYSLLIMHDRDMYDDRTKACANARNSAIVEDLGQIEYILTDKTGTLTQNVMEFQKCSIQMKSWGSPELPAHKDEKLQDLVKAEMEDEMLYFKALGICHTVSREEVEGEVEFQSVSPDEVALVEAGNGAGVVLVETEEDSHYTIEYNGKREKWRIIRILKFNSDRKRMSVVAENEATGEVVLWSKGADDMMFARVQIEGYREVIDMTRKHLGDYAREGLRTLVVAYKPFSREEWESYSEDLQTADNVVGEGRRAAVDGVYEKIENDMILLGTTAIEDKLQEEVQKTIWMLREAGIAVWMLTGDKFETAKQIGFSCNLVDYNQKLHEIVGQKPEEIYESIMKANNFQEEHKNVNYSLIIEGKTLKIAFENYRSRFKKLCLGADTVVCARVTPNQKADIVNLVKKEGKMTLSIGDGGNDVPMIQEAHVGVGITGKEGLQASRAADFSFGKFKFLIPLIFVHGHYSLIRSGIVIQYSFYKNITLAFLQVLYNVLTRMSGESPYNDLSLSGFNSFFTVFVPVLIFDRFIDKKYLKNRPKLYMYSKDRKTYHFTSFALWFLCSILHGTIILFVTAICYSDNVTPQKTASPSVQYFGIVVFTSISFAVDLTFLVFSHSFNCCNICVITSILIFYFLFLFVYNICYWVTSLPVVKDINILAGDDSEIFWVMMEQFRDPTAYFGVIFAVSLCILSLLVFKYLKLKLASNVIEDFHTVERRYKRFRKMKKSRRNVEGFELREKRLLEIGGGYVEGEGKKDKEFDDDDETEITTTDVIFGDDKVGREDFMNVEEESEAFIDQDRLQVDDFREERQDEIEDREKPVDVIADEDEEVEEKKMEEDIIDNDDDDDDSPEVRESLDVFDPIEEDQKDGIIE